MATIVRSTVVPDGVDIVCTLSDGTAATFHAAPGVLPANAMLAVQSGAVNDQLQSFCNASETTYFANQAAQAGQAQSAAIAQVAADIAALAAMDQTQDDSTTDDTTDSTVTTGQRTTGTVAQQQAASVAADVAQLQTDAAQLASDSAGGQ